jgi:hypothetical protein
MRTVLPLLALATALSGCAGYALDYTKPKASLIAPELARYGLDQRQAECVGGKLTESLSVWQLRQLQLAASALKQGYVAPPRVTPADLIWVATTVESPKVGVEMKRAAGECGLSTTTPAAAPPRVAAPSLPTVSPAAPAANTAAAWVNLGAASTGQAIAIDASSLSGSGGTRSGWFRLTNPGEVRGNVSYLLRVDCAARTINSMAIRRFDASGAVTENRDFGANGEGAAAIERGTVMEIAYLALCT